MVFSKDYPNEKQDILLKLFYKAGSSNDIYSSIVSPSDDTNDITCLEKKISMPNGTNPQSSLSPSSVIFNNKLYLIYKAGKSNDIYYASFDGTSWTGDIRIDIDRTNPQTSHSPSIVIFNNKLYIIYKAGKSNNIYYASFDGTSWTGDIR
ncbi:MAG: hypothetical protein QNJ54_23255 [Prochloraceae cyanobacterium]|nr:hypothetical protein [Prochloraceae cyanobacterium]